MVSVGAGCSQLLSDMQAFKVDSSYKVYHMDFQEVYESNWHSLCVLGCKSWLYLGRFCQMALPPWLDRRWAKWWGSRVCWSSWFIFYKRSPKQSNAKGRFILYPGDHNYSITCSFSKVMSRLILKDITASYCMFLRQMYLTWNVYSSEFSCLLNHKLLHSSFSLNICDQINLVLDYVIYFTKQVEVECAATYLNLYLILSCKWICNDAR